MPVATSELLAELDRLLEPSRFEDYCVNGLQVPGPAMISSIASGVSAHAELFQLAAQRNVDLLLVHHGLFWGAGVRALDAQLKRRLQLLFDANVALAAYHQPLDAHPQVGNNALLARALGGEQLEPFAPHRGQSIGFLASFAGHGLPAAELFRRVEHITARTPLVFEAGPQRVQRIAIVSGAGADYIPDACAAGAHALLTGEVSERTMAQARESGLHVIAAGHYATETLGIRQVGELLAERFALEHTFLDVPNPV